MNAKFKYFGVIHHKKPIYNYKGVSVVKKLTFISILLIIFVSGCAVAPTPQNAKEYRTGVIKGGYGTAIDSYTVNRSYSRVIRTITAKSKTCLRKKLTKEYCTTSVSGSTNCYTDSFSYKPTFVKGRNKSELHIQMKQTNAHFLGGEPPKGGMYIAVIDIFKAGKNKTKIKVYSPKKFFLSVPKAVKHWAKGSNLGCPDFTQAL